MLAFHVNSPDIFADYAQRQQLNTAKQVYRQDLRCPSGDCSFIYKTHGHYVNEHHARKNRKEKSEDGNKTQRRNAKRSDSVQRKPNHFSQSVNSGEYQH